MSVRDVARVLVVDDEPELRELLLDALSTADMQVSAAGSGQEAIDLARQARPDILVTDLRLGDCTGLDVIDRLRAMAGDIPAVVITAYGDPATLTWASRHRPVELMTKPLDLDRLRQAIREELARRANCRLVKHRTLRLRLLARKTNIERKNIHRKLDKTCADLAAAYRTLSGQMTLQQALIAYQQHLLKVTNDDDVFRGLFTLFVRRSGAVFGVAMVCDADAELQLGGRFGVPNPDDFRFCSSLAKPVVSLVLARPECTTIDAGEEMDIFDPSIHKYLPGLSILAVPLIPAEGELIGLVIFYRKGEQPFKDSDVALAQIVALPTALAVRRNE